MNAFSKFLAGLLAALGLGHPAGMAAGEIAADYQAGVAGNPAVAPSPSTQGWTAGTPTVDVGNFASVAVSPDGATGYNAWRMLDNSTAASQFITWNRTLTSIQHAAAAANGWQMTTRLRVADPVAGNAGANSTVLLYGNNAGKRWILFFDLNAAGEIVTTLAGGATVTLTGIDAAVPHEHALVYNAATGRAEYLVDGVSKATGYAGTTGTYNGIQWGTGSTGGRGDGYWNRVSFVLEDPPAPPAPRVTADPVSVAVAEGGSVQFQATFSGTVEAIQWFKDAVPLAGAEADVLQIPSAGAAETGDYWCRATNAEGRAETRTASLSLLSAGGGLVISEFLAENEGGLRDSDGSRSDWIEIRNLSDAPLGTAGYFLTDDPALPNKWVLPAEILAPGAQRLVRASGKNRALAGSEWHTNFSIQNDGGYLALVRPDLSAASAFTYPKQFADQSYGETAHVPPLRRYFSEPTPGMPNVDGQTSVKDGITFSPLPGTFTGNLVLDAVASGGAGGTLRYTTDGHPPGFDSTAFPGTLTLTGSSRIRAAVVFPGERYGAAAYGAWLRVAADAQGFTSPLPLVLLSNHGAGAVPGVSARGPNGDGSEVVAVPLQAQSLLVLDEEVGATTMTSPVAHRSRAGLKIRGSSSFSFAEKSYSLETWGERDGMERELPLLGMPADADWVLYGPDPAQFDVTLLHNSITYALARACGFGAPRFRFVELFIDSGGDLAMADHRGLAILMEKPSRGKDRIAFDHASDDGTAGGWMVGVDRMDALPPGSAPGSMVPRHFHSAGPDRLLQTPDDNPRGYQAIQTPGGAGSGSGVTPANDDMPNFYHSFFNFESPSGWSITPAQRGVIESAMDSFDAALYAPDFADPVTGYAPKIDGPNWARHLILQCLFKNQDAIVLSGYLYRERPTAPIRWGTVWDFDRAFTRNATNGSATGNLTWAHDRLYYRRLVTDPEFMQAYIDEWQTLRRGPLTKAAMQALVDAQAAEITGTVAARSGLSEATWNTNLAAMKAWLGARGDAIDALYTAPPVPSQAGGSVPEGFVLTLGVPEGTIVYTTDGSDPRQRGGADGLTAMVFTAPIAITVPTTVTARARVGSAWSGPVSATYFPPQDLTALRVSEIHYHPEDETTLFVEGSEFEFLEFKNVGSGALDVGGLTFTAGIQFTFAPDTEIAPGAFFVLVRNSVRFAERFPGVVIGAVYSGKLDNAGETLTLARGSEVLWSFAYGDDPPWRPEADGSGFSLQRPDPEAPGYDVATWAAAPPTPGADLSDTDGDSDGMPDYWEILHGFLMGVADGDGDADGDGTPNAAEFAAGTDPRDPASRFVLEAVTVAPGEVALEFKALAGRAYTVQWSDDLQQWLPLRQIPAGATTRVEHSSESFQPERRYYRAVTPPRFPAP